MDGLLRNRSCFLWFAAVVAKSTSPNELVGLPNSCRGLGVAPPLCAILENGMARWSGSSLHSLTL